MVQLVDVAAATTFCFEDVKVLSTIVLRQLTCSLCDGLMNCLGKSRNVLLIQRGDVDTS